LIPVDEDGTQEDDSLVPVGSVSSNKGSAPTGTLASEKWVHQVTWPGEGYCAPLEALLPAEDRGEGARQESSQEGEEAAYEEQPSGSSDEDGGEGARQESNLEGKEDAVEYQPAGSSDEDEESLDLDGKYRGDSEESDEEAGKEEGRAAEEKKAREKLIMLQLMRKAESLKKPWETMQGEDKSLKKLRGTVKVNGVIMKNKKIVVPRQLRGILLYLAHGEQASHDGINATSE
jgi:hypothetical protein